MGHGAAPTPCIGLPNPGGALHATRQRFADFALLTSLRVHQEFRPTKVQTQEFQRCPWACNQRINLRWKSKPLNALSNRGVVVPWSRTPPEPGPRRINSQPSTLWLLNHFLKLRAEHIHLTAQSV